MAIDCWTAPICKIELPPVWSNLAAVHVVTAFGMRNLISSFDTEFISVTSFPHNLSEIPVFSLIGKPVPTILPSKPPLIPIDEGVIEEITRGIVIDEIEAVLA